LCCPVTQRLGKQLSRKIFCLVGIFKELEQALLVCHGGPYLSGIVNKMSSLFII